MGKNKGSKKGNALFRVAGGKAAKAKAKLKAQPVSTNLKKVFGKFIKQVTLSCQHQFYFYLAEHKYSIQDWGIR